MTHGPLSWLILRDAGARLICQVQTLSQAREAMEAGADVIVAQGTEAGGNGRSPRAAIHAAPVSS